MTTLPAEAGRFCLVAAPLALAGASRATLAATHYVSARRPDPGLLERAVTLPQQSRRSRFFSLRVGRYRTLFPQESTLKSRRSQANGIHFTHGPAPWNLPNVSSMLRCRVIVPHSGSPVKLRAACAAVAYAIRIPLRR